MGKREKYFIDGMVRMLGRVRPQFNRLEPDVQRQLAGLIWQASSKIREHTKYEGAVFFTYRELDEKFGRRRFLPLNEKLDMFEVLAENPNQGYARGFKLKPDIVRAQRSMLRHIRTNRPIVRLLLEDGTYMRAAPEPLAAKDMSGRTASKWEGVDNMMLTPVNIEMLSDLLRWLEQQIKTNTDDLFSAVDIDHLRRLEEFAGKILAMANTDVAGRGFVIHRYVEANSGRLYAQNINLQTAPKLVKQAALHGLWEYDIENCHYSIFDQMAHRAGFEATNIRRYLADKKPTREGIAKRVGISIEQAKVCLLAVMYGARASTFHENAIPQAVGEEAARRLYKDEVFAGIMEDIKKGRKIILAAQPTSRGTIKNAVGKFISRKDPETDKPTPPAELLAHLIQGVEASMLKIVIRLYGSEIALLQHDGFASRTRLDVRLLERAIHEETGYSVTLEEVQIWIPADLNSTEL